MGATLYWQPNHVYEYNTAGYLIGENDCRNEDERIAYQEYSVVDPGGHVRHVKSDKSYWPNNLIYDLDNFIYKYIKSGNRMKHIQGKKQDNLSEKDYPVPGISNGSSVSDSEVSLGGIPYQASESYVKSIYGNPTSNKTVYVDNELKRGYVTTWKYGDSVSVDFIDGRVTHVTVTANNGFATPAGAYVGMKESVLQRLYGDPRKHGSGTNGCSYEYYRSEKDDYLGIRFDCQDGIYNGTMN